MGDEAKTTEETTLQKVQKWAANLPQDMSENGKVVVDYVKNASGKIGEAVLDKEGNPDIQALIRAGGEGVDKLKTAGKNLADKGLAFYEEEGPKVAETLENNKFGIGGGLLAMILGMSLLEMGPIAALLIGLLVFAAISVIGGDENGLLKEYGPQKKKDNEQEKGVYGLDKDRDGKISAAELDVNKDGKLAEEDKKLIAQQVGDADKVKTLFDNLAKQGVQFDGKEVKNIAQQYTPSPAELGSTKKGL